MGRSPELTGTEQEILQLLTEEYQTIKQIARRRNCSEQAVRKVRVRLRRMGYLTVNNENAQRLREVVAKQGGVRNHSQPSLHVETHQIRLHAVQVRVRILQGSDRYRDRLSREGNLYSFKSHRVCLYRDSLFLSVNEMFYAPSEDEATTLMLEELHKILVYLEHDLSLVLLKPRVLNLKITNNHYAEVNNELAVVRDRDGSRQLKVFASDDGRLVYHVDNSFNLHEFEAPHPQTAADDMIRARKHLTDWRDNDPPTLTELYRAMVDLAEYNKETAAGLAVLTSTINKQHLTPQPESNFESVSGGDYIG